MMAWCGIMRQFHHYPKGIMSVTKPQYITVRITRAEFLKLPMSARRRILDQQAESHLRALKREWERRKPIMFGPRHKPWCPKIGT